ncbi:hypothetical protein GCM10017621_06710 [Maricaulis virginensis]|uniref:Uncharacterized protein n=1 Tax=Maricaulis virginensis TaxID=144022 RepID=A0A9W6MMM4_9PROT|nr:hypothetical protein GCM10017621_06710 [Maricaulis virginensis]
MRLKQQAPQATQSNAVSDIGVSKIHRAKTASRPGPRRAGTYARTRPSASEILGGASSPEYFPFFPDTRQRDPGPTGDSSLEGVRGRSRLCGPLSRAIRPGKMDDFLSPAGEKRALTLR